MSRLEELIRELCPDGVEYKPVKAVYKRLKGTSITAGKMKEIADPDGEIKIFAGGKTIINAHECDITNANITRVPAVLVQSRGVIDVVYYDKPFTFKNEMWAYTTDNVVAVKFLYYVLKNNIQRFRDTASGMGSLPQISLPVTEDFLIPVPPLPVQREIVRILDSFTDLTAELEAELEARKKQYEYYRDQLLNFDARMGTTNVAWRTLCEVASVSRGVRVVKKELSATEKYPVFQDSLTPMGYYKNRNRYAGTTFVISAGAAGDIGYSSVDFWAADDCFTFECCDLLRNRFLYHVLMSNQNFIRSHVRKASIPRLSREVLEKMKIPVPPTKVQDRLIEVLDNFDNICSDLNIGLPAEINARQKQYEYYRDKLLTFDAMSTTILGSDRIGSDRIGSDLA